MATFDRMIIDDRDLANQYFGDNDLDDDQYLFSKQQQLQPSSNDIDNNNAGLFGRRVFLESPSLGNKDEEDIYR